MSDSRKFITETLMNASLKEKLIAWLVFLVAGITIWHMLDLVLLTFIMTFIFYHLLMIIQRRLMQWLPVRIPDPLILFLLYGLFAAILVITSVKVVPIIAVQLTELGSVLSSFDIKSFAGALDPRLHDLVLKIDVKRYLGEAGNLVASGATMVGSFGFYIFLAYILSLLILIEMDEIKKFGKRVEHSSIAFIYAYFLFLGKSFVQTFGKVMKVQVLIAFINSVLSALGLLLMGFPQILGLGLMILILGMIPVAGVAISLVPLSVIAFNIGGIMKVVGVIIMILLIHTLEAYVLNPKLMSHKTRLPVAFVFIVLILGEHYLGVWGLLIGVPLFIFMLKATNIKYGGG